MSGFFIVARLFFSILIIRCVVIFLFISTQWCELYLHVLK
ncbi:hypothetical protein DAQ1742_03650 [Dickeya aquatica]|uniref:Uncharacterized protein n=1 Tax=Dickeya aquatica TaxID=1401087 RepID=A0A375AEC0_9GAMM|nr:hypothetical protein DAQ1742_03650 [Dickeya aquatica]